MKRISSHDNALFKALAKLAASARERRKSRATLLDGVHLVETYLQTGGVPELLVVSASAQQHAEILPLLERAPQHVVVMSDALFDAIAPVKTPTGILAQIAIPHHAPPPKLEFCLLLEDLQDPGNLGSILRSAAAAGVQCVFLSPHCADVWSPKVLRAAMGAHFHLALSEHADLQLAARSFHGKVYAMALAAQQPLFAANLAGAVAFIIGNEGAGISPALLELAGEQVAIPMPGHAESLNAAAAAAVCLFERVRQASAVSKKA